MNHRLTLSSAGAYSALAVVMVILLLIISIPLFILGIAGAAFSRLGFTWIEAVAVLILMLAGSLVDVPLYTFRTMPDPADRNGPVILDAFSGEPVLDQQQLTTFSLNFGGAVIPAGISVYLLNELWRLDPGSGMLPVVTCTLFVTVITFLTTKILPVWGLRAPLVFPGLIALACGLLFSGGSLGLSAGVAAFVGGITGVLAGATACGLVNGVKQGIARISIGGSGMFGSVILCAVLSALAAG